MGLENQHVNAGCPMFVPAEGFYETGFAQYKQANVGVTIKASGGVMGGGSETFLAQPVYEMHGQDSRVRELEDVCTTVSATYGTGGGNVPVTIQPIALAENTIGRQPQNGGNGDGFTDGGPMYTLNATGVHGVAQPIAVGTDLYNLSITGDVAACMSTAGSTSSKTGPTVMQAMAVRRLTPVECERLQGFPDSYTDIKSKNKPTPDGPRYKALGNSMAVPVMAWIGARIQQYEDMQ
jgi:DNA (cytosine-5)-methyltransferase 1